MHIHDKDRIVKRCVEFYEELYRSRRASADQDSHDDPTTTSTIDPPSMLQIRSWGINKETKAQSKHSGEVNITGGMIQDWGDVMVQVLTYLFNTCLHHRQVPKAWENVVIVLMHKKRNTPDMKTTYQSAYIPLCTRCFQTFFYKGWFVRWTSTNRVASRI